MNCVVFLGPSLSLNQAKAELDAIYLPPAAQSDLISAVRIYHPEVIALIDGTFLTRPSVWHKEILYALSQGIHVYGASSMGALRAAELESFGMVGVGQIYQMYASGSLMDDDEVALVYGSAETGYQPLSVPMINVRATLQLAQAQGILSADRSAQLIGLAKSIYFAERTFSAIFQQASIAGIDAEVLSDLKDFMDRNYVDLKRQDALLLLKTLRDQKIPRSNDHDLESLPSSPDFDLAQTHVYAALQECDRQVRRQGVQIPLRRIAESVALHTPDFEDLNVHSLNRLLTQVLATLLEITVDPAAIEQEKQRFRVNHRLQQAADFDQWLQDNDLSEAEFEALMQELAVCRHLHRWFLNRQAYQRNVKGILDELRLQNLYSIWANAVADQERVLQDHHVDLNDPIYRNLSLVDLLRDHVRKTDFQIPGVSLSEWIFEAGFLSLACFQVELIRAKAARDADSSPNQDLT